MSNAKEKRNKWWFGSICSLCDILNEAPKMFFKITHPSRKKSLIENTSLKVSC